MSLRITLGTYGTHADVQPAVPEAATSPGVRLIEPGESCFGIPYELWAEHQHQTVDVLALQYSSEQRRLRESRGATVAGARAAERVHPSSARLRGVLIAVAAAALLGTLGSLLWIPFSWGYASAAMLLMFLGSLWDRKLSERPGACIGQCFAVWLITGAAAPVYRNQEPFGATLLQYAGILLLAASTALLVLDLSHRIWQRGPRAGSSM